MRIPWGGLLIATYVLIVEVLIVTGFLVAREIINNQSAVARPMPCLENEEYAWVDFPNTARCRIDEG